MNKLIIPIIIATLFAAPIFTSDLDDFEEDVTTEDVDEETEEEEEEEEEDSDYGSDSGESSPFCSLLFEIFLRLLGYALIHGGAESWNIINPENPVVLFDEESYYTNIRPRRLGEPVIPFIKADVNAQYINQEIMGIHGLVELGAGPIGLQYEHLQFVEFDPLDTLFFDKVCGYYRMVFARALELDIGGGFIVMTGNDSYSGGVASFPVHLFLGYIAVEFRPEWWFMSGVSVISHYDLSFHYCIRYCTFHLGYKWIRGPGSNLDGAVLGISFRL